jgi:hypothetical protein
MNLIEVFALLTAVALTLRMGTCLRINRRKVMRAESMMRCPGFHSERYFMRIR